MAHLRGGEGVFGIGTVEEDAGPAGGVAWQPKPHRQCLGPLNLSWYALSEGASGYRPLPVELTLGPDLAKPLRSVWPVIECHAERLDRVVRQQSDVEISVVAGRHSPALALTIPLAVGGDAVRVLLEGKEVRFYVERAGELLAADLGDVRVDQGLYLLLADLAGRDE